MDGEHLEHERVSSPSYMSQIHFQTTAEVTPSKEVNFTTGSSMDSEDDDVDGFGPPPAFPTNKSLGKRKLTLMSVSTSTAGFRVEDAVNSEDESSSSESSKHSQLVHRINGGASSDKSSRGNSPSSVKEEEEEEEEKGQKRTYNDAMILASLSDVGSPKKKEEMYAEEDADEDRKHQVKLEFEASPKSHHSTSSTACTPLRSNVNSASDGVKPFALLPKPYANKRGKLVHEARKKEEHRDARPPPPFPGPYGGYPYPHPHPHGPPPPHHPGPYAGYPYPYPPPPPPPPGSMPPSAYYGMHGHGPPPPTPMPPTPEYWGQYHSPEHATETIDLARGEPPFHPLTSPVKSSHVVPADESDSKRSGYPHPGPPHAHAYPGPPPPGYPGYYPPPSIEYKRSFTVSMDESSPSRQSTETSPRAAHPRPEMHPSSSSPPRPRPPSGYPESPYSGYPPSHSSGGDPYQPYDYASASPSIQYPPPHAGNYQFRKGGRTMHSEPIILKKKFSWRNYPEVRKW